MPLQNIHFSVLNKLKFNVMSATGKHELECCNQKKRGESVRMDKSKQQHTNRFVFIVAFFCCIRLSINVKVEILVLRW